MLTVNEVAKLLNVTPQAIYKKVNKQLNNELKEHIEVVKRGNKLVKMIKPEGVEIIKQSLEQPVNEPINEPINNVEQPVVELLKEQFEVLRLQLGVKDKQIQELNDRLREQQELNRNNQVLLHREQEQKALPEPTGWGKIKNFFKG